MLFTKHADTAPDGRPSSDFVKYYLLYVVRPCIQCIPLLFMPVIPLVYAYDASTRTGYVIKHGFRHFQPYTKSLQPGC